VSRMEKNIFDKFINQVVLKKRRVGAPYKYYNGSVDEFPRFYNMIFFPKNRFERLVSNFFESSLPTLQYCLWNPVTYWARVGGWTEQEKLYHNFWRGDYIQYHIQTQSMHPSAFIERHRADAFYRRVRTFLPGCTLPDWAKHTHRAVDFDYEGAMNPFRAQATVLRESTPKPHYGYSFPSSLCHIGNWRWTLGRFASRYFYNEEIRGGVSTTGAVNETDRNKMNSWYNDAEGRQYALQNEMTPEEIEEESRQAERWIKNIEEFFPEQSNYKFPKNLNRVEEPYFLRSLNNVLQAIFIQRYVKVMKEGVFTSHEMQQIYQFFLHHNMEQFFKLEDNTYTPTELYTKFVDTFNLPNVFNLDKYTARVVEEQYLDTWQENYNVTVETVESYSRVYNNLLSQVNFECQDMNRGARMYLTEEVYNPLFKYLVMQSAGLDESSESVVVRTLNAHGKQGLDVLKRCSQEAQEQLYFISPEKQKEFMTNVRTVVKTFPFQAYNIPKVQF